MKAGGAVGRDWRDTAASPRSWRGQEGTSLRASRGSTAPHTPLISDQSVRVATRPQYAVLSDF